MAGDNRKVAEQLFNEVWRDRRADRLDVYCTDDCRFYDPMTASAGLGRQEYENLIRDFDRTFTTVKAELCDVTEAGDTVAFRWRARFRMTGPFEGIPPNNREADAEGAGILKFRNGKVCEQRSVGNLLTTFLALGLVRPAAELHAGAEASPPA
jgi:predicted ester cyclase